MEIAIEHTLSDVLRKPNPVLREAERQDVLIRRRGNQRDMVLTDAGRARALRETLSTLTRLLDTAVRENIVHVLSENVYKDLPWTLYLPPEERQQFVTELMQVASASAETSEFTPLAMLLRDWQATALAYANPALYTELTEPLEATELPSLLEEDELSLGASQSSSSRRPKSSSGAKGRKNLGKGSGKSAVTKKPARSRSAAASKKGTKQKRSEQLVSMQSRAAR